MFKTHLTRAVLSVTMSLWAAAPTAWADAPQAEPTAQVAANIFLSPADLDELMQKHTVGHDLIILDARSGNLQPDDLRTPKARPGAGYSQYLFRVGDDDEAGDLDVARYAAILGGAGIDHTDTVVVYGSFAGEEDGSVPAMILDMLGHEGDIHFLDGHGLERWQSAGFDVTATPTTLPATDYQAQPRDQALWNLDDVQANLGNQQVVFYDTRSLPEFTGDNPRDNQRGGHIPGAIRIDGADLMDADKVTLAAEAIAAAHEAAGMTPDKTIVLYCQTSTRVSLPYLALRQLGYENLAVYDASMHEYLNRSDTDVATGP